MSEYNVFTAWRHHLTGEQAADVRQWFGHLRYDAYPDADIGMALNGMFWDDVFSKVSTRLPKLRQGFRPQVSALAAAVGSDPVQPMAASVNVDDVTCKDHGQRIYKARSVGMSEIPTPNLGQTRLMRWKPGHPITEPPKVEVVNWDDTAVDNVSAAFARAVNPDVDSWVRSIIGEPYTDPDRHQPLLARRLSHRQPDYLKSIVHASMPVTVSVPPPARSSEDIIQELQEFSRMIEEAKAADRARQLTTAQVMQLCYHFELYTLDAIVEFIKEHQR